MESGRYRPVGNRVYDEIRMEGLSRDERKLEAKKLLASRIESVWDDLQTSVRRVVAAHNSLHPGDESKNWVNDHDTAICVSYQYRASDRLTIVNALLKLSIDREAGALRVTGKPDVKQMRALGSFTLNPDTASGEIHFLDKNGESLSALQVADRAVAEWFFDKKA